MAADDAVAASLGVAASPLVVNGTCRAAVLFGSMSPDVAESDVKLIARLLLNAYDPSRRHPELDEIGEQVGAVLEETWQEGYELAERVHDQLAFDTRARIDLEGTIERLKIRLGTIELSDRDVRGISLTSPVHCPTIVVNSRFANNRREEVRRSPWRTSSATFCSTKTSSTSWRWLQGRERPRQSSSAPTRSQRCS